MTQSKRLDERLALVARAAGLDSLAAAEAMDDLYLTWADAAEAELDGVSPRRFAAALEQQELLDWLVQGAALRNGEPPRLLAEEVLARLNHEAKTAAVTGQGHLPTLDALAALALEEPVAEADGVEPDYTGIAAVEILQRWSHPTAVPWLMAVLATENPKLRTAAAQALASIGLPSLGPLANALFHTRDEQLRRGLFDAITRLPRDERVMAVLMRAWAESGTADRRALAEGIGRHDDPAFIPILMDEARTSPPSRLYWATYRVALGRLGHPEMPVPPPPPLPDDPEVDLLAGCHTLVDGGLMVQAREWLQEGLLALEDRSHDHPEQLDWFVYEQFQDLADQLWARGPEAARQRFREYAVGALHYYGALRLEELIALVGMASAMTEPDVATLWAELADDPRLSTHPDYVVALAGIDDPVAILTQRAESGLPPALLPLRAMALAARDRVHSAWTSAEAEAAERLMAHLPPELATPQQVVELQQAIRGAHRSGASRDEFRSWLRSALSQGVDPSQELKDALADLWTHTARWDLFGHSPWTAKQVVEVLEGRDEAAIAPDDPCPCGSGRPFAECCGQKH